MLSATATWPVLTGGSASDTPAASPHGHAAPESPGTSWISHKLVQCLSSDLVLRTLKVKGELEMVFGEKYFLLARHICEV